MSLPLSLLIEVNSTSVKDTFTLGKLPTLLITQEASVPVDEITYYTSLATLKEVFKSGGVVDFATEYFGFTSKNATKADYLGVFNYSPIATAGILRGATAPALAEIKKLNGKFGLSIDGAKAVDITADLSGATDFTNAAELLQTAIRATTTGGYKAAEVVFDSTTSGFIIKSGTKGTASSVSPLTAPTSGTDISASLGLSTAEGASAIAGRAALTFAEALDKISLANGNSYVITTDFTLTDDELLTFAKWLNASNMRYLGVYSDKSLLEKDTTALQAYNGLLLDYKLGDNQNAIVSAYLSSIDTSKANSNVNIAFNDMSVFANQAVTSESVYNTLGQKRLNAPCKFGILGQDDTIYMDGSICGTLTDSVNVYFGESVLNFNTQIQLYNMFKSAKIIGSRDTQSQNTINGYVAEVMEDAVAGGYIARGAELTTTEKSVLVQTFTSDDMDGIYNQIQKFGYYFAITDINVAKREISITRAYTANTPLKKLVIADYILGA